jgi:hypothetical protein
VALASEPDRNRLNSFAVRAVAQSGQSAGLQNQWPGVRIPPALLRLIPTDLLFRVSSPILTRALEPICPRFAPGFRFPPILFERGFDGTLCLFAPKRGPLPVNPVRFGSLETQAEAEVSRAGALRRSQRLWSLPGPRPAATAAGVSDLRACSRGFDLGVFREGGAMGAPHGSRQSFATCSTSEPLWTGCRLSLSLKPLSVTEWPTAWSFSQERTRRRSATIRRVP